MKPLFSCFATSVLLCATAHVHAAASFDCAKASTAFEKAVCKSEVLSKLDQQIAQAYQQARERLAAEPASLAALLQVQRDYLRKGDVFLQTRMENQLEFLRGIDGTPRQGLAGLWNLPTGGISLTADQKGKLEITASTTTGTPPNFYNCEWEGSPVSAAVDTAKSTEGGGWTLRLTRKGSLLVAEDIPPVQDPNSQPSYCTTGGRLAGVYFASKDMSNVPKIKTANKSATKTTGSSASSTNTNSKYYVTQLIKSLPLSAFENTNDGMDETELNDLLNRGQSDNWQVKSLANTRAEFVAKVPFCVVDLTMVEMDHKTMLQVITSNRREVTHSYWQSSNTNKALVPYYPTLLMRAVYEGGKELQNTPMSDVPDDIAKYVNTGEACQHWSGEVSDDLSPARKQEITKAIAKLGCTKQNAVDKTLRSKYAKDPRWIALLNRYKGILGD
ncbi:MAG TPA: hypothetical protein PKC80_03550 [Burkholderiaceae bacterium]|nr:hypothetical protein [Burkholderiaceae bacterium]